MNGVELAIAAVLGTLAVRSAVHWGRRPFESSDVIDHALYALFVVCRVGLWLVLATWFVVLGSAREPTDYAAERALLDAQRTRAVWLATLFVVLAGGQFATAWFLGRRRNADDPPARPRL
jgi:hypothetical protein